MIRFEPHARDAGFIAERRRGPRLSDGGLGLVTVYDAVKADMDTNGGRWVTMCQTHGTLVNHSNLRDARSTMHAGSEEFCDECEG